MQKICDCIYRFRVTFLSLSAYYKHILPKGLFHRSKTGVLFRIVITHQCIPPNRWKRRICSKLHVERKIKQPCL